MQQVSISDEVIVFNREFIDTLRKQLIGFSDPVFKLDRFVHMKIIDHWKAEKICIDSGFHTVFDSFMKGSSQDQRIVWFTAGKRNQLPFVLQFVFEFALISCFNTGM